MFYIVHIYLKIAYVITYVITFIITELTHPLHINPPLNLSPHITKPIPNLTHIPPQKQQKCFTIQYDHNKCIVLMFWCKYIAVKAT